VSSWKKYEYHDSFDVRFFATTQCARRRDKLLHCPPVLAAFAQSGIAWEDVDVGSRGYFEEEMIRFDVDDDDDDNGISLFPSAGSGTTNSFLSVRATSTLALPLYNSMYNSCDVSFLHIFESTRTSPAYCAAKTYRYSNKSWCFCLMRRSHSV